MTEKNLNLGQYICENKQSLVGLISSMHETVAWLREAVENKDIERLKSELKFLEWLIEKIKTNNITIFGEEIHEYLYSGVAVRPEGVGSDSSGEDKKGTNI